MWARVRRWLRRGAAVAPPDGYDGPTVVEVIVGERRFPCDVYEDPQRDEEGMRVFWAVPREPIEGACGQMRLYVDVLPPRSMVRMTPRDVW